MPSELKAESDQSYMGFASRLDPANLPDGILQAAQNIRLQRGIAQPRKGCQRLTDTSLNELTMVSSGLFVDAQGRDNIAMIFTDSLYLYLPAQGANPEDTLGPYMFPSGRTIAQNGIADAVQALDKLIIFRGKYDSTFFAASLSNNNIASGNQGLITITTLGNHGYSTGDEVTVRHYKFDTESRIDGNHIITVTSLTQFTFLWQNTSNNDFHAHTNKTGFTAQRGKPPLIWDSFTSTFTVANQQFVDPSSGTALTYLTKSIPPADFGFYYQNRIVCKVTEHQLAVSDILETTFDLSLNNFTINQGGNDVIVGCLPWIENQFLVFMRNSIFLAYVETTSFLKGSKPGLKSQITVVTTQIGCLARQTIVNAGQFVFFLSSKGVHVLTPQLDLKAVGNTMPLSEPISNIFDTINYQTVNNAVATYYNNRFYIAVPISTENINASGKNNRILIYSTLNKAWESVDVYPDGMNIDNLIPVSYLFEKRLFIITNFSFTAGPTSGIPLPVNLPFSFGSGTPEYGGIFLEEQREDGDFFSGGDAGIVLPVSLPFTLVNNASVNSINSFARTREFTMKSLSEKYFSRGEFQFNNVQRDVIHISGTVHDPDSTQFLLGYQFAGNSDGTLRPRIAMRGASVDFTIQFASGRPALKGVTVYGITANRPMISQE